MSAASSSEVEMKAGHPPAGGYLVARVGVVLCTLFTTANIRVVPKMLGVSTCFPHMFYVYTMSAHFNRSKSCHVNIGIYMSFLPSFNLLMHKASIL